MSDRWIKECETILKQIREVTKEASKDRLEAVRAMRFTLYAIHRSVLGWLGWVNNPDVMSEFSLEELEEMSKILTNYAETFIEYDAKVTGKGGEKTLAQEDKSHKKPQGLYV